ncbi:type I-B CRISPR-associated protein Cas7/Csh2 (plasmid) [Fulvitalea axinellae]|uniref:Type I-B CRISPR-associated protein Cas7/Csh2 n=1 Tax=Fulvitalea axinellae TaxID=1182444 RepID=A0AAU9DH90_9BACT|nr:type I-B CRISPR-associated protein Cas7/Csh2 [Fulvitalea axinellae]
MTIFKNRVFGCAIVKAVNANYNADFSGQPRTLPNGVVYATDKAFKYTVKNFLKEVYPENRIMYFKSLNANGNPISLDESYEKHFEKMPNKPKKGDVAKNLLSCLDIRMFGATFAVKSTNISIHGPVQINHGTNIWKENHIYAEQITSPFSNKSNDKDAEKGMTTIGRQSKLEEGHYAHHFSVNPKNLEDVAVVAGEGAQGLTEADIALLKEGMSKGATYYDSASKAGTENELLLWIQLKEDSRLVLPNIASLLVCEEEKVDGKVVYDCRKLSELLARVSEQVETVELRLNAGTVACRNLAVEGLAVSDIVSGGTMDAKEAVLSEEMA